MEESSVVFPAPTGPMIAVNPGLMDKLRSWRAARESSGDQVIVAFSKTKRESDEGITWSRTSLCDVEWSSNEAREDEEAGLTRRNASMRLKHDIAWVRDGKAWHNWRTGSVTRLIRASEANT